MSLSSEDMTDRTIEMNLQVQAMKSFFKKWSFNMTRWQFRI